MNFRVKDIHLGSIHTTAGFEKFLYEGGTIAELLTQNNIQPPMGIPANVRWVVNPSFQQRFLTGGKSVLVFEEDPIWIIHAVAYLSTHHQDTPVFLGAADERGNYVTCEIAESFPPTSSFTSISLHNLSTRTQATFSAKQQSGTIAILDCHQGREYGEVEQFLRNSGIAHSPVISMSPMDTPSALSNLIQCIQLAFSIERRTHYRASTKSIPWFTDERSDQRSGLLLSIDSSPNLTVQIAEPQPPTAAQPINRTQFLIAVAGSTQDELLTQLAEVNTWIEQGVSIAKMEKLSWSLQQKAEQKYHLCLVADTHEKLREEMGHAQKGISSSLQSGKEWQSRGGSYFTPHPLGKDAKIAFVYPGAFNSYIGMGAELLHCFPFLHDWLSNHNDNPAEIYQAANLFPENWGKVSGEQLETMQKNLLSHPLSMLFSGTAIAGMYTCLLEDVFDVHPDAAYGYSLGEIMMFFATGYWQNTVSVKKEITESNLYQNRIAGSMNAVREFWNEMGFSYTDAEIIWNNMILMTNLEKVKAAVDQEPLVYLTHINTHRQVVIGGEPEACQRVVSELGCMRFPIPVNYPMHCPPVASEYETLRELNLQTTSNPTAVRFYSAFNKGPYTLETNAIAEAVAGGLVNPVDFDALTKRIYDDGYRIFIEVGARSNCSKWIERSLKSQDFCATSVNQAEVADETCLMKVIARLISHGKKVTLPVVMED